MMARTHIPFAMSCWWLYSLATGLPVHGISSLVAAVGGLLPDLDHPKSALGRKIPLVSIPLSALFGHRGFTHSLLAVGLVGVALVHITALPFSAPLHWMIAPLCVGYLSHLMGDSLTPSGIPLFYPLKKTYSLNVFKTNSRKEFITIGALTFALFFGAGIGKQALEQTLYTIKSNLTLDPVIPL